MGKMVEPIAKRLNQSAESALLTASAKRASEEEDIAERIRRLEAELDSSSDSDSDDGDDDSDSNATKHDDNDAPAVLNLSKYAAERIDALPDALLPAKRVAFPMHADKKPKKRKRSDAQASTDNNSSSMSAAHQAILELVQPVKKVPFACKRCAFVGRDLAAFDAHKASPAHIATLNETASLTCVLCSKTFTSVAQLDEHRKGKWHLQRMQHKKQRHVVRKCYDFQRTGSCKFGDRCEFEHIAPKSQSTKKNKRACAQLQATGSCKFGDTCLFVHAAP